MSHSPTRSGAADAVSFDRLLALHADWLSVERGLSPNTLAAYRRDLRRYAAFLTAAGLSPADVAPPDVAAFLQSLGRGERPLRPPSVARHLAAVRSLHRFCVDEGLLESDPTELTVSPKLPQAVPKALEEDEVVELLGIVPGSGPAALRDRAILELLYGTGMRISELCGLDVDDVDLDAAVVRCFGKGRKERVVPLGSYARAAVEQYLVRARPQFLRDRVSGRALVLNQRGGRLSRQGCWQIVRRYGDRAGLGDRLTPHVLRHSCATHMIEHGADIRMVQEMLGHASIATTQIYTRVSQRRLRQVFMDAHPRARLAGRTAPSARPGPRGH